MTPERRREVAARGNARQKEAGKRPCFDAEWAREAGREGGLRAHERGKAHTFTPGEAREAAARSAESKRRRRGHAGDGEAMAGEGGDS